MRGSHRSLRRTGRCGAWELQFVHNRRNTLTASLANVSLKGIGGQKRLGGWMFGGFCRVALLLLAIPSAGHSGCLAQNPEEVLATVYERLGTLTTSAARDPFVWLRLQELKREPCDQNSLN